MLIEESLEFDIKRDKLYAHIGIESEFTHSVVEETKFYSEEDLKKNLIP